MRTAPVSAASPSRPSPRSARCLLLALLLVLGQTPTRSAAAPSASVAEAAPRTERLLPRLAGPRLGGGRTGTDLLSKRRGIVYVFASTDTDATRVAEIVGRLEADALNANIAFLGLNRDREPALALSFIKAHGFGFPILAGRDPSLAGKLPIAPGESAVLVIDAEGYIVGGFSRLEGEPDLDLAYESEVRRILHLEKVEGSVTPSLGLLPRAPDFEVRSLEGDRPLTLADLEGKVAVLVFFSPTCPHCHLSLQFLDRLSQRLAHPDLLIAAISVSNHKYVLEDMAERLELTLTLYVDPERTARKAFAHRHLVPDVLVLDRQQRVVLRHHGSDARAEALITMEIRQALGIANPLLLDRSGYNGEKACRSCHRSQHQTWALTRHAYAFETLVEHGEERNPECLPCHTVGWDQPGGYSLKTPLPHLRDVQCENCHGRGGPHQSPTFAAQGYEPLCLTCHNTQHSLRFRFAERLPEISHAANLHLAALGLEERQALLVKRDRRARTLFDPGSYVGSEACRSCHASEYELWSRSAHAHAQETLGASDAQDNADCQRCHTTGFSEKGGYPEGGEPLLQVGCESCHGPGSHHVERDPPAPGTILALTDKCDSCVILQICGSCHDEANDPGFEFELTDKLERIRHGFRELGDAAR